MIAAYCAIIDIISSMVDCGRIPGVLVFEAFCMFCAQIDAAIFNICIAVTLKWYIILIL